MGFQLEIKTGNAAFEGDLWSEEVAHILRKTAKLIEAGFAEGVIHDTNGNKVGYFTDFDEDEEAGDGDQA
jgi:hypothetical protein